SAIAGKNGRVRQLAPNSDGIVGELWEDTGRIVGNRRLNCFRIEDSDGRIRGDESEASYMPASVAAHSKPDGTGIADHQAIGFEIDGYFSSCGAQRIFQLAQPQKPRETQREVEGTRRGGPPVQEPWIKFECQRDRRDQSPAANAVPPTYYGNDNVWNRVINGHPLLVRRSAIARQMATNSNASGYT